MRFENEIREEVANKRPLLGPSLPIDLGLGDEYMQGGNVNFMRKIAEISKKYQCLRQTRGDGNCFFRAFSCGMIDGVLGFSKNKNKESVEIQQFFISSFLSKVLHLLEKSPFDKMAYEDFYEELAAYLNPQSSAKVGNLDDLALDWETNPFKSHSLVVLLRLVASAYLREHAMEYVPFLLLSEENKTSSELMESYCQRQVECLGIESDQIHIIALTRALQCTVNIAYLDGSEGPLSIITFSPDSGMLIA